MDLEYVLCEIGRYSDAIVLAALVVAMVGFVLFNWRKA